MGLTYGLKNSRDLYEKLKRDANRLEEQVSSDAMFDFFITAHHLREWIKHDRALPRESRKRLTTIERRPEIKMCADIATASKHMSALRRETKIREVKSRKGFGHGRLGKGPFGNGEEEITIELNTGESINALDFCGKILELCRPLFEAS